MAQTPTVAFTRDVPVRHTVDVMVAGGGPAGVAAAVTAARQGRRVFLAEGQAAFGGMGTLGLVPAFMPWGDGEHFLAGGFGREVHDRLFAAGGAGPDDRPDSVGSTSIRVEVLKRLYDDMVTETGMAFAFQTHLVGVAAAGGRVEHAVCWAKSGLFAVRAAVFVDATGDGDLAAWAGAPFEKGDPKGRLMPGTLCSLWADVDWDAVRQAGLNAEQELPRAFRDKVFTVEDRHLPGMWRVGTRVAGGNVGHTFGVDATDERSLTEALVWGRRSLAEYERFYKTYMKGFEKMELVTTGGLLGIRETRRIMGDYVLALDDFKRRAVFDDEIGRFAYPVDVHASSAEEKDFAAFKKEFTSLRYARGESYGIPYRALVPRGLENVLVAGRCLSADRYLQGSVRVMPGCFITGQAAGMAAALAAEKRCPVRSVSARDLQGRLARMGAYLPNFRA